MNIQPYQIILVAIYITLGTIWWQLKPGTLRWIIIFIALTIFFVNPVRFKQENFTAVEKGTARFDDVPSKVEVATPRYEDFHNSELAKIKQQSEDRKDEIHN